FFQAEDGIRDKLVTGVQTCALPISQSDDYLRMWIVLIARITQEIRKSGLLHSPSVVKGLRGLAIVGRDRSLPGGQGALRGFERRSEERRVGKEWRFRGGEEGQQERR